MARPEIGATLTVHIDILSTEAGGRTRPVSSGYRPVCVFQDQGGGDVSIGLCELRVAEPVNPGASGDGRLSFDVAVSDQVRSLIEVGSRFMLAEGTRPIGSAEVRAIHS